MPRGARFNRLSGPFLALALVAPAAHADLGGPDDPLVQGPVTPAPALSRGVFGPALLFELYQRHLGGSRGFQCPMEPSCSRFAQRAIHARGPFVGLELTAERILRCGRDLGYYRLIWTPRGLMHEDPVP